MSVELNFNICISSDCSTLEFTETTGEYSATNTGGWETPNEATTDAESAILEITSENNVVTTINLFSNTPIYPTINKDQKYIIEPSDLGYTTSKFPDGIYSFKYTVARTTATAFSYYTVVRKIFFCQTKCCVQSLFADIDDFECECNATKLDLALKADALLTGLKYAANCGQESTFTNIMTTINNICDQTGNCSDC